MLKIRFKDNKYNAVWLVEPKITIGRSATNALVVDDPLVCDVHLEVQVDNERLTLHNLVPTQPVIVNGQAVNGACELKAGDEISIGAVELVVIDPKREARSAAAAPATTTQLRMQKVTGWSLKANHAALINKVFPLGDLTTIGRSADCDISLPAAHLSRRHAQLQVLDGMLFVKDLDSANGTYLNGKRVAEARVKRGDELRFDALSFGVMGPADDLAKTAVRKTPVADKGAEVSSPGVSKATTAARAPAVVRSASPRVAKELHPSSLQPNHHSNGKYGLIILAFLAVAVITALILTRK